MQIFIHRNNTEGLIGYNADGSFVPLHIIQDNMFKLYDKTITSINYDKNLGYQIVRIPTTDGIPTYQLRQPAQQVIAMRGGGGGGGIKGINVQEEGVPIGIKTTFNFIGLGATATNVGGGVVEIDIPGGIACADNGLNIGIGGCVELGGTLFHNTIIDFDGFDLTFDFNGGNFNFQNVPVSVAPTSFLTLDAGGNIQANATGASNGLFWALDGNTNGIERYIGTNDTFDFPIYTDGTEKMRVLTTGEVGINTVLPLANLHVVSTGLTQIGFLVDVPKAAVPVPAALPTQVNNAFRVNEYGMVMIGVVNVNDAMLEILGYYPPEITSQYLIAIKDNSSNVAFRIRGDKQIEMFDNVGIGILPATTIRTYIAGFGTSSSTFSLACVDGSGNNIFSVRDDGAVQVNPVFPYTFAPANAFNVTGENQTTLTLYNNSSNVNLFTEDAFSIDKGATLSLGGKFGSGAGDFFGFASIRGAKENSTDGDGDGYMALYTLRQGTGTIERARINSRGNFGLGVTAWGYCVGYKCRSSYWYSKRNTTNNFSCWNDTNFFC